MSAWSHLANAKHIDRIIAHAKAWSHLANAKHIDRIIAHAKANPKVWDAVQDERHPARNAAWNAALGTAWDADATLGTAYDAACDAERDAAYVAAWDAILALVVWDRTGDLMDSPAEQVKVLAILGDQAAILLYPAIAAMETTQELV